MPPRKTVRFLGIPVLWVILLVIVSGCDFTQISAFNNATSTPSLTPRPTFTPRPSATNVPTNTVTPFEVETQNTSPTPSLSGSETAGPTNTKAPPRPVQPTEPPTIAKTEMTYPLHMKLGEPGKVTLQIAFDPSVASTVPGRNGVPIIINAERPSNGTPPAIVEDTLLVSPVMAAELVAPNFTEAKSIDVLNPPRAERNFSVRKFAVWTWDIIPTMPGNQNITINIYAQTTQDGKQSLDLIKSIQRNVEVEDRPWTERLQNWVGSNIGLIGTTGPLGLVLAYLAFRASQKNNDGKPNPQEKDEGKQNTPEKDESRLNTPRKGGKKRKNGL
ncbi:MAG: hypothetical protein WCF84_26880 [Anaerolineae bacterium]